MRRRVRGNRARTVLTGGKAGDNLKGLPIGITTAFQPTKKFEVVRVGNLFFS